MRATRETLGNRARRRVVARILEINRRVEAFYIKGLRNIATANANEVNKFLGPKLSQIAKGGKTDGVNTQLGHEFDLLDLKIQAAIPAQVGPVSLKQAGRVLESNATALKLIGVDYHDARLGGQIAAFRDKNIDLMVKAGRDYAASVKEILDDPSSYDLAPRDLAELIQARGEVSQSRAELIARDQTLKLNGQITQTRQENAGISSYIWSTSLDERVRETHAAHEGQTFSWSSPPSDTGAPGQDFQCRCVGLPVIEGLEDV